LSLEAYQYVLCRMVASSEFRTLVQRRPTETFLGLELTERERTRLVSIANQSGMRVNTAIHRANRLATVAQTMPLTCFLISTRMQEVFDRYWSANPTESLQLPVECERFATFLERELQSGRIEDPYLGEIVSFERACTKLRFYTASELKEYRLSDEGLPVLVSIVHFRHDPIALLNSLSEVRIPAQIETGDFHLAIDWRSGEPDFRLLDGAGLRSLRRLIPRRDPSAGVVAP
jgi:hypothetical protein